MGNLFPSNFLWGAATAGYQVEGNICNNDWDFFTSNPVIRARVATLGKLASPPEHFRQTWAHAGATRVARRPLPPCLPPSPLPKSTPQGTPEVRLYAAIHPYRTIQMLP
ncbi:MAG TPA: family 1 glycosylhydrolase [Candidatus Tectomicrobia bacterium]